MSSASSLVSSTNHVEVPFIIVQIGDYTFGHCGKPDIAKLKTKFNIEYPNYMESLNITKINGSVNTYTLTMTYAITSQDDPNRFEKVFSSISNSRTIILKYGDWNSPSHIYKDEKAIITKLTTRVNLKNSTIQYIINCTSDALALTGASHTFSAKKAKPSDEIKRLLKNKTYGLKDLFTGMKSVDPSIFIDGTDKVVQLEAKPSMNVLDYIS